MKILIAIIVLPVIVFAVPPMDSWQMNPPGTAYLIQTYNDGQGYKDFSGVATTTRGEGSPGLGPTSWTSVGGKGAAVFAPVWNTSADTYKVHYASDPTAMPISCILAMVDSDGYDPTYNVNVISLEANEGRNAHDGFRLLSMNNDAAWYCQMFADNDTYNNLHYNNSEIGFGSALDPLLITSQYRRSQLSANGEMYLNNRAEATSSLNYLGSRTPTWLGWMEIGASYRIPNSTYTYQMSFSGNIYFYAMLSEYVSSDLIAEKWELYKAGELE